MKIIDIEKELKKRNLKSEEELIKTLYKEGYVLILKGCAHEGENYESNISADNISDISDVSFCVVL